MSSPSDDGFTLERVFDAPRELVFANWVEGDLLGAWFAPADFEVVECAIEACPGGRFRIAYRAPSGPIYVEHGEILELEAPERLRLTLINENEHGEVMVRTEVRIVLTERDGKTLMSFRQTGLASAKLRQSVREGWESCLDKLGRQLASELEIRALFRAWSDASARKDIDASMAPVAKHVLSYEHEAPLVYRGVDALRETCRVGFDRAPDTFRWDVPDLRVIVRGDIAVTWGLNHMHGSGVEMWSRGTRIFQRIDGRWQLVHQHVSFPISAGSAREGV